MKKCHWLFLAAALFLGGPVTVGAEEIYGSGCDPDTRSVICAASDDGSGLRCGARVVSMGTPTSTPTPTAMSVAVYDIGTEQELAFCMDFGVGYCDLTTPPDREWFLLEVEVPCGNGSLYWRDIMRVVPEGLESAPYSESTLERLGMRNDRTMLGMARFHLLKAATKPYPQDPSWQK